MTDYCTYTIDDTTWMEKWWIPINWACHHVKKEQLSGGHLPKEGKEVASALIKFNANLDLVAQYKHNPLPALASQAVHFVYWGSLFFAAFCIEPTNFDASGWSGAFLVSKHTCKICPKMPSLDSQPVHFVYMLGIFVLCYILH